LISKRAEPRVQLKTPHTIVDHPTPSISFAVALIML